MFQGLDKNEGLQLYLRIEIEFLFRLKEFKSIPVFFYEVLKIKAFLINIKVLSILWVFVNYCRRKYF